MKIIVDAMGGDNAPAEIVRGAVMAAGEFGVEIVLVGRGEDILSVLHGDALDELPAGVEIAHASQMVEMCDNPSSVIKEKPDSSMVAGLNMLASGAGDAFVSAGSTGALLTGATLLVKRVKGIRRAALAPIMPTAQGPALLIDSGANVECTPEYLLQFAYLGAFYAERVLNKEKPRVGLLNIGTEREKGSPLHKETYTLLEKAGRINFTGNIEARDFIFGEADVIVADGFAGNVLLKACEGMGLFFVSSLKEIFLKNAFTKLSALMVRDGIGELRKKMDYNETGGAPLLGISKPVIKAHGSSKAYSIRSAIKQAVSFVGNDVIAEINANIELMKTGEDS